jgi:hypothetical protein
MTTDNWGCPDWRDASAYPDELELDQWQWQFMRRHPKYREIAARGEQIEYEFDDENQKTFMYMLFEPINDDRETLQKMFRIYSTPCPHPKESILLTSDAPYWLGDRYPLPEAFGGINPGLIDIPSGLEVIDEDTKEVDWSKTDRARRKMFEKHIGRICKAIEKGRCSLVVFDHTKSLTKQIKKAKEAIRLRHAALRNERKSLTLDMKYWPRHLRIIDAKDQDATHPKIYEHFAEERSGGNDDALDDFYRPGRQPKAVVSQWHSQAVEVMEKASRLL